MHACLHCVCICVPRPATYQIGRGIHELIMNKSFNPIIIINNQFNDIMYMY